VATNSLVDAAKCFSICGNSFDVGGCHLLSDILQSIFSKGERLVLSPNSICPSPGSINVQGLLKASEQRPHFVTKKASEYCCDTDCPMCKGVFTHCLLCLSRQLLARFPFKSYK